MTMIPQVDKMIYKFRAECIHDVYAFTRHFNLVIVGIVKPERLMPDVEVVVETTTSLETLQEHVGGEDWHTIHDTIEHFSNYTGERK